MSNIGQQNIRIQHVLISSWRKEPAVNLATRLAAIGIELTASGGTADAIEKAGLRVCKLDTITGFNNLLGGRVKTLHPAVHAAILARRDLPRDMADLEHFNLQPFDLVAVDLYPFPADTDTVSSSSLIELIDIGGVALIRAAAKNFRYLLTVCTADDFEAAAKIIEVNNGHVPPEFALQSAIKVFRFTAVYDARIADRLARDFFNQDSH